MSYEFNDNLLKQFRQELASKAVSAAAISLRNTATDLVNRGASTKRINSKGRRVWAGGSTSPNPPFNYTGALFQNIKADLREAKGSNPSARVGPDGKIIPYAARLEFGFVGTDSKGRTYNQGPRPYMRRALNEGAKKAGDEAIKAAGSVFRKFASRGGR